MAGILAFADAVDIGGGRGRLAAPAAASLARVDVVFRSAFGRAADINEAWRSPAQADKNYAAYLAWLAYQAGKGPKVPWAPIALPASVSIHCRGYAIDTDDTTDTHMRIWNEHGWFWTVYRDGKLVERWHLEYDPSRDQHRNDPALAGNASAPFVPEQEEAMPDRFIVSHKVSEAQTNLYRVGPDVPGGMQHITPDFLDVATAPWWNLTDGKPLLAGLPTFDTRGNNGAGAALGNTIAFDLIVANYAEKPDEVNVHVDVDEAAIAANVVAALSPATLAAQIVAAGLADAVVAALGAKLAG